ncbi:MAG: hypothetical protein JW786_03570 [Desulfobacterales bacterium]|nr:hypothetical protein [Desulfobacterales bacterium]
MAKRSKKYGVSILSTVVAIMVVAFMAASGLAQEYPPGMISYWKFDEGGGNIAYDSVGNNHGTIYGAIRTIGKVDGALIFDGIDDGVEISYNFSIPEVTIEAWVKRYSNPPDSIFNPVVYKTNTAYDDWGLSVSENERACVHDDIDDANQELYKTYIDTNWHHLVGILHSNLTNELFVDGQSKGNDDLSSDDWTSFVGNLYIGYRGSATYQHFFYGIIDEVAIYNRALTPEEIQKHYQNGLEGRGYEIGGPPIANAGTSLDGNNMLQLDGTLSSDPQGDPLTFSWQVEGENTPHIGQIVSIADLPVGNYQVTLTVSDGIYTDTDTMLFGIPTGSGVAPPPVDDLQQQVHNIKDKIASFSTCSFDAPNDKAAENRRKALLNMLDKVSEHIDAGDFQAAIDQLQDILAKSDGLLPDWIIDDPTTPETNEQQEAAQSISILISDLETLL